MERLQKVLAHAGVASRRAAEQMILDGKVQVNNTVVKELGIKVDPEKDVILVNGKPITKEQKRTLMFFKPLGVITAMSDPEGRRTVADFFEEVPERVYPVGRLDYNTDGLLIMTNDGELAKRMMHPRYELKKTYSLVTRGIPKEEELDRLRAGIRLEDGMTAPAEIEVIYRDKVKEEAKIEIIIHEGRNRQVRRMFERIGYPVKRLRRIQIGPLTLKAMRKGEFRDLTDREMTRLLDELGMSK